MPTDEYTISSLTQSSGITNTDLLELATPDLSSETGYSSVSATVVQLAIHILKDILFSSDLHTNNKTIIGAINEIFASGGGSILYGTSAPTAQQGSNGNLYVQYTAGTGGADDTVDALYVKLDGSWCEIETGGGGSGGHTIVDDSGTSLTQRTKLQFNGAYSEDNSTDDTTKVNVVREMTKAEFDLLSADEKTGFINITDITGGNDDRFQPVIYSTEEREIGVWVDGKPLYEKVFTVSQMTISSSWTNTAIDTTDIDTIASAFGIAPDGTFYSGLDGDPTLSSHTVLALRSYATSYIVKLILQYTKISDTAGSGQWTPQGVPAHHYSEDEQVVGTWIDGSTVYERVFDLGSDVNVANDTLSDTTIDASNMDKIIYSVGQYSTGVTLYPLMANINNNIIRLQSDRNGNVGASVRYVILQYTKSST